MTNTTYSGMSLLHFMVQMRSKSMTEGGHGNKLHGGRSRKLTVHILNGKPEAERANWIKWELFILKVHL